MARLFVKLTLQCHGKLYIVEGKCEETIHSYFPSIDHFTVVCLVTWPLNENEAGGDLVLIETSLLFLCKFVLISMKTT